MRHLPLPPIEYLHECFEYFPDTGALLWRVRPEGHFKAGEKHTTAQVAKNWNARFAGKHAGTWAQRPEGGFYLYVKLDGIRHTASRIMFALGHGADPGGREVDHEDRNSTNNKLENLRLATTSQNNHNQSQRRDNTSGYVGVRWFAPGRKWAARIRIAGRLKHLGYFNTSEEAHEAYVHAKNLAAQEFMPLEIRAA